MREKEREKTERERKSVRVGEERRSNDNSKENYVVEHRVTVSVDCVTAP